MSSVGEERNEALRSKLPTFFNEKRKTESGKPKTETKNPVPVTENKQKTNCVLKHPRRKCLRGYLDKQIHDLCGFFDGLCNPL